MMPPQARGARSEQLLDALRSRPHAVAVTAPLNCRLDDEDAQLSLFLCYQLHYHGIDGVDDAWEWQPDLLRLRAAWETSFEAELLRACPVPPATPPEDLAATMTRLVESDGAPSLSGYLQRRATVDEVRHWLTVRSLYQLAEADPHTFGIPRLQGRAKAALVEIQADEYGGGRPERMHSQLFAQTMQVFGLDTRYGAYLDEAPASALAAHNAMSLFGLHRRLRGALLGHLAALEMTSTAPNRRYGQGLRRLGFGRPATDYFDEHVEADAAHEQIALHDMCGSFVADHPQEAATVLWGAAVCLFLDGEVARTLLDRWQAEQFTPTAPVRSIA